jgi:hypothetical protein
VSTKSSVPRTQKKYWKKNGVQNMRGGGKAPASLGGAVATATASSNATARDATSRPQSPAFKRLKPMGGSGASSRQSAEGGGGAALGRRSTFPPLTAPMLECAAQAYKNPMLIEGCVAVLIVEYSTIPHHTSPSSAMFLARCVLCPPPSSVTAALPLHHVGIHLCLS